MFQDDIWSFSRAHQHGRGKCFNYTKKNLFTKPVIFERDNSNSHSQLLLAPCNVVARLGIPHLVFRQEREVLLLSFINHCFGSRKSNKLPALFAISQQYCEQEALLCTHRKRMDHPTRTFHSSVSSPLTAIGKNSSL